MALPLDEASLRELYSKQGYLAALKIFEPSSAEHAHIRDGFEAMDRNEKLRNGLADITTRADTYQSLIDRHFDQPWVWELATTPGILDVVESLIGPNIMCLATHIFVKHPPVATGEGADISSNTGVFVDWHQDATYWGLDNPENVITAWYAIDHSNLANGCLQIIPGSHTKLVDHGKSEKEGNLLASNQAIPLDAATLATAVNMELQPGEMSVHHGRTIHGSCPNLSSFRRCGVTLRYVPPSVRQVTDSNNKGKTWKAICVRGCDHFKNFGDIQPPVFAPGSSIESLEKRAKRLKAWQDRV